MLRGTKKQIIHLKNPESPLFEEAFLIVKHDPPSGTNSRTLAEEASRLLADPYKPETPTSPTHPARGVRQVLLGFLLGAACGAAVLTLCLLL